MGIAAHIAAWDKRWPHVAPGPRGTGVVPVTFGPGVPLAVNVYIALGADPAAHPSTWTWTDISEYVRYASGVSVTTGRANESSTATPSKASMTLDNRDGRFSRRNATGPYYGLLTRNTPILVTINPGNGEYRAVEQYVNEWPARWDKTGTDHYVPIKCGGIMRRLGQGQVLRSAAYRAISASSPTHWWTLEDGRDTTSAAASTTGTPPLTAVVAISGANPGAGSVTFGTEGPAGAVAAVDVGLGGSLYAELPYPAVTPTSCRVEIGFRQTRRQVSVSATVVWEWYTPNRVTRWRLLVDGGGIVSLFYTPNDGSGTQSLDFFSTNHNLKDDRWHRIRLDVTKNGATSCDVDLSVDNETPESATITAMPFDIVREMWLSPGGATSSGFDEDSFVSHPAVWYPIPVSDSQTASAMLGWVGETAVARVQRLCGESGVTATVQDAASTSLGPQPVASFLAILRDAEKADGGVLYEVGHGLGYVPHSVRYSAPVAMALDVSRGDLAETPESTDDDQGLFNSWTITRTGGTPQTHTDDDSVAEIGLYNDGDGVNVETDDQALHDAEWRVHLGLDDDLRWPAIDLNFANIAGRNLIGTWVQLGYGARITIAELPDQVTIDLVDLFIEGRTEWFTRLEWTAKINTSRAGGYRAFQIEAPPNSDGNNRGRLGVTQILESAINSVTTSITTDTPGGDPLLTTTATFPEDFPYDIVIGGERMTVTGTVGASSVQTSTVVRSVNGVVKGHVDQAPVALWHPGVLAR